VNDLFPLLGVESNGTEQQWSSTDLNGLTLLHVHIDVNVDRVKILDKFDL
jgi:hypothetical protein